MDEKIKKKNWTAGRIVLIVCLLAIVSSVAYLFAVRPDGTQLRIDSNRMSRIIPAKVGFGEFREYFPSDARVEPITSVFLDVETGGRVEEIFVEDGTFVTEGELILRFSNTSHQTRSIDTETRLLENLDLQRSTMLRLEKDRLVNEETRLSLDYQISESERKYRLYQQLMEDSVISREDYLSVKNEFILLKKKKELLEKRIEKEERLGQIQLDQAEKSLERLELSRALLEKTIESLDVTASISGYLSSFEAQIGQNIGAGTRIGQIDLLDELKLRAGIDQHYLPRVNIGTQGTFDLDGNTYDVEVRKIYPEVRQKEFFVDLTFVGEAPDGIRRGQTLQVKLYFSEAGEIMKVSKGGFYNQTSGRWVYLIAEDRMSAYRWDIRTGRHNPRDVEVLEGLKEGDWIIASGYDAYNEIDTLLFPEPIQLDE